ncbi:UDP-N-acetylglucosamine-peptide N-acetylglucosaminyltransferase [Modestobacter sp. VKM Ac-2983]|uniref:tetratricopeptide repeat protein n=1 Tax=Modestobacter sp. VKM Ac-2983 TaxID=3004137 RepID=UPI0022AB9075|nr:UDP-N-acetylglucosamine-peptide N-acetylglucosaminyltransferase [Modestobacter sp. VKM Ac-2983]MCZ2806890.1 UDP-N-acetylglucosamine-peptide N-acetylglucosaminyltransferase [Modestobacter sp. VKM Ac-2983]
MPLDPENTPDVDVLVDRGCALADMGDHERAVELLGTAAAHGDPVALRHLGSCLGVLGRWAEAAVVHRRAADAGQDAAWLDLARALLRLGCWSEAESAARTAVDRGDAGGWAALSEALQGQDRAPEAERAFRVAAERGADAAALELAYLLRSSGRQLAAWHWAQAAADAGNPVARATLACWRWQESRDLALEPELRAGADHHPHTRTALADLLRCTGRVEEARVVLERGAARGELASWLPLGNLYRDELDDAVAAEAAYRAGVEGGDLHAHHDLGVLLLETGDVDTAVEHFSIAAAGGDELAARLLREVLAEEG